MFQDIKSFDVRKCLQGLIQVMVKLYMQLSFYKVPKIYFSTLPKKVLYK